MGTNSKSSILGGCRSFLGVAGYSDAQSKLEQISSLKVRLDEQKGATLEEMSHMVDQLNAHIAAKKTELAPLIKVCPIEICVLWTSPPVVCDAIDHQRGSRQVNE